LAGNLRNFHLQVQELSLSNSTNLTTFLYALYIMYVLFDGTIEGSYTIKNLIRGKNRMDSIIRGSLSACPTPSGEKDYV